MAYIELKQYEPLLHKLSNQYYQKVNKAIFEKDDLFNIAYIGLDKAVKTYKDDKGATFFTYAYFLIKRELYNQTIGRSEKDIKNSKFNNVAKSIFEEVSSSTENIQIIDTISDTIYLYDDIDYKLYIDEEFRRIINIMQQVLSADERKVLINYYCREKTLEQLAQKLNISVERVRQLISAAIKKLRKIPYIHNRVLEVMEEETRQYNCMQKTESILDVMLIREKIKMFKLYSCGWYRLEDKKRTFLSSFYIFNYIFYL